MKLALFYFVLLLSCQSKDVGQPDCFSEESKPIGSLHDVLIQEEHAEYKHDISIVLKNISTAIAGLPVDDVANTKGIYQLQIDTSGVVSSVQTVRSISETIDAKISSIFDTLSFYPAELNGNKIKSKFTIPVRIELK